MKTIDVRVLVADDTDPEALVARLAGFEDEPPVTVLGAVELVDDRPPFTGTVPGANLRTSADAAKWRGEVR